jgi:hypothetical protein
MQQTSTQELELSLNVTSNITSWIMPNIYTYSVIDNANTDPAIPGTKKHNANVVTSTTEQETANPTIHTGRTYTTDGFVDMSSPDTTDVVTSGDDDWTDDEDDDYDDFDDDDMEIPTEQRLMYMLLRHYERSVRPVRNASHPVLVRMGLTLTQIFDMVRTEVFPIARIYLII